MTAFVRSFWGWRPALRSKAACAHSTPEPTTIVQYLERLRKNLSREKESHRGDRDYPEEYRCFSSGVGLRHAAVRRCPVVRKSVPSASPAVPALPPFSDAGVPQSLRSRPSVPPNPARLRLASRSKPECNGATTLFLSHAGKHDLSVIGRLQICHSTIIGGRARCVSGAPGARPATATLNPSVAG